MSNNSNSRGKVKCFNCGKIGHISRNCRTKNLNNNSDKPVVIPDLPGFIDSHCHVEYLYDKYKTSSYNVIYSKIKQLAPSFEGCISNFCDPASLSPSFGIWKDLLDNETGIYGCFGIHPHQAKNYTDSIELRIIDCLQHEKALAWGECGLDYHYNHSPKDIQKQVFTRQLLKAVELQKSIVIHSRKAAVDTLEILSNCVPSNWKLHIHCFTDDANAAQNIMNKFPNAYFGFTGVVTYDSSKSICEALDIIPANRILLETDAPYMVPNGLQGRISHPGMCIEIAKFIANRKSIDLKELLLIIRENTKNVYGI